MRAGVIDIGSRSIKLLIGEKNKEDITVLESLKNIIPIANDTFLKDRILQDTINHTATVLENYGKVLKDYDVPQCKVIATTAVREARNKDIFTDAILRKTGFKVEVLTPGDIVYYIDSYLYHRLRDTYPVHEKNLLIAELGSGSLDVSILEQGFSRMHIGLPLGPLRLKQLVTSLNGSLEETSEALGEYIANEFSYLKRHIPSSVDDVILIDENYTQYIANLLPGKKQEKFFLLGASDTQTMLDELGDKSPDEISRAYKIPADSAETITAYCIILNTFFQLTRNAQIYILETSLAEAILANELLDLDLSRKYNKMNQLISFAQAICRKYNADLAHGEYVAGLCEVLFNGLREQLGLKKDTLLYLLLAAYLHDIGMFIHNRSHHKHSEYIINSINLFRLAPEEIQIIACIARYHRKAPPSVTHPLYNSLSGDEQITVQKLSAILRIANALDRSHKQKVKRLELKVAKNDEVTLVATVGENFILEQEDFMDKKALLEEITGSRIHITTRSS